MSTCLPYPRGAGLVAAALLAVAFAASAPAQDGGRSPARPVHPRDRGLEDRPLVVESLGLELYPPAGATFQLQRLEDRVSVSLVDGSEIPRWSMRIQPLEFRGGVPTAAGQIARMLEQWRAGGREFTEVSNEAVRVAGREAQLCFIRQEAATGDAIVSGWLVVPGDEGDFLAFAIQTMPEDLATIRPLLDACFSTISLEPLSEIAQSRKERLDAGRAFVSSLGPETLRLLLGRKRWYRFYVPADQGSAAADTELGYYMVEFSEDALGAIDPSRTPAAYSPSEQTRGLLVHVHGHYLEAGTASTYDSEAFYWVAWDQSEEAWSIRGTRRHRGNAVSEALTGIRTPRRAGDPGGTLTVVNSGTNAAARDQKSWRVPDVYLSQAIRWGLGPLLAATRHEPLEMNSYCFDNTGGRLALALRLDRWEPAGGGAGRSRMTSVARSDAAEVVSLYDAAGNLVRRSWPDGPVTESITLDELHRLWKTKGLATAPTDR